MILAEDELAIGIDHDGIMVLDDALAAGTPLADVLPIATDVLELEITPNRPDCLGVYGVAREVHAATGAPLAPAPWSEDPHPAGDAIPGFRVEVAGARAVPALHRAAVRGRDDRPVAGVAEGAPDGRRPAPDQQRRRHHQLRDAAHGPADARVRRRPRGRRHAGRAPRRRRGDDDDARRRRAHARPRDVRDRRRRGADLDRRHHGRRALRGARQDDARADGGGDLERAEHPAHVDAARPAHGGVRPVREAAPARAGARGPGGRGAADGRAVRRAAGRRHDRRRRPRPRAAGPSACATRARSGCSARRCRARTPRASWRALGFGVDGRRGRARRHRAGLAPRATSSARPT